MHAGWLLAVAAAGLLTAFALDAKPRITPAERRAAVIRASDSYRWGEGRGTSVEQAKEAARHELVTKIRTLITSTAVHELTETESALISEHRIANRVLSVMQLEGLAYLELTPLNDHYRFLAFVPEAALQSSMARQRAQIRSMAVQAVQAASEGRLDDALRLTYWAYLLAHTVDTVAVALPGVRLSDPRQALVQSLDFLVDRVSFQAAPAVLEHGIIGVPLQVTYEGQPATVDLWLYTGAGMDFPHVSEGRGYIELHWDPETLSAREQELQLRLLYAYEGWMGRFPEIEALHELLGQQELDTWVEVPVVFPFVEEEPALEPSRRLVSKALPETSQQAPLAVRVLASQTETEAFMDALQIYARNGRLSYHRERPEPGVAQAGSLGMYVAVMTGNRVLGVFLVGEEGYIEVRQQVRLTSLERPEFAGGYKVWLMPTQP